MALVLLTACKKENVLSLRNLSNSEEYLPDFSSTPVYTTLNADTAEMVKVYEKTYFDDLPGDGQEIGNLGSYDRINLMRHQVAYESDTPYFRVEYLLASEYEPKSTTRQKDILTVSYFEEPGVIASQLVLNIADTTLCESSGCRFTDSLYTQDSILFLDVYYLDLSEQATSVYINNVSGEKLAGFRTTGNIIYKLTD